MSQANCQFCGSSLASDDKACQFCGQPIPGASSPAPEVPDSYVVPPEPYQAPVQEAATSEPFYSSPPANQNVGPIPAAPKSASPMRGILIVVIILVVLCCCVVVVIFALFSNMDINMGLHPYKQTLVEILRLAI